MGNGISVEVFERNIFKEKLAFEVFERNLLLQEFVSKSSKRIVFKKSCGRMVRKEEFLKGCLSEGFAWRNF